MNAILTYFATAMATVTATDMERWKSGISVVLVAVFITTATRKILIDSPIRRCYILAKFCTRQKLK